jgi:GH18 family chitinase
MRRCSWPFATSVVLATLAVGCARAKSRPGAFAKTSAYGFGAAARPVVAAYLPDYRLSDFEPSAIEGLTDVILFSVQPGADGHVRDDHGLLGRLQSFAALRRRGGPRILLSVGGGGPGRSDGFSAAASDPARRARLARELAALAADLGFDGLDLDWEHHRGAADAPAFAALAGELESALAPRGLLLTAAVSDLDLLDAAAIRALDRVHLMTYDGPTHGSLAQVEEKVRQALERGIPALKLCVGIPLYGRGAKAGQELAWAKLAAEHRPAPEADETAGYRFSGVETTRAKARLARRRGLGGVMFWELAQDSREVSLIRAAREVLFQESDVAGGGG